MNSIIKTNGNDESPSPAQNSIWETLKTPFDVIKSIVFILIAISPFISSYIILSFLGEYNAEYIAYNMFSNLPGLGIIIIYGLIEVFFIFGFLLIAPFFLGYNGGNFDLNYLNNTKKIEKIIIITAESILILVFFHNTKFIFLIALTYLITFLTFFLSYLLSHHLNKKNKNDEKNELYIDKSLYTFDGFQYSLIFIANLFILFLLYLGIITHFPEHTLLIIYIILIISIFYIMGYGFAFNKREFKNEIKFLLLFFIFSLFSFITFLPIYIPNFSIQKIIMSETELGNYSVKINFKTEKLPSYIQKRLKNANITNYKKVFLLIQSANSYYIMKKNSKTGCIVKVPKKYAYIQVCKKNTSSNNKNTKTTVTTKKTK